MKERIKDKGRERRSGSDQRCRVPAPGQGLAFLSREIQGARGYGPSHRPSPMLVVTPDPRTLTLKKVDSIVPGLDTKNSFLALGSCREFSTSQRGNKGLLPIGV